MDLQSSWSSAVGRLQRCLAQQVLKARHLSDAVFHLVRSEQDGGGEIPSERVQRQTQPVFFLILNPVYEFGETQLIVEETTGSHEKLYVE
jgi:hypothetical protein